MRKGCRRVQFADANQTIHQDRVLRHQGFIFIYAFGKDFQEIADSRFKFHRHIAPQSTWTDESRHHALTRTQFENIEDDLTFTEAIYKHRHRTEVKAECA